MEYAIELSVLIGIVLGALILRDFNKLSKQQENDR